MKKRHLIGYPAVAIGFFLIGLVWGVFSETFFKIDMLNMYQDTEDYSLNLSFKKKGLILLFNTREQVEARVEAAMIDIITDVTAPYPIREMLNEVNKEKNKEKKKILEEFMEFLKEKKEEKKIKI